MITETIVVAILSLVGTLAGAYLANKKTTALVIYRLEQLEGKVNKHNEVIERTYKLEEHEAVIDEKIEVINHRVKDLEQFHK